jgi:iron-sulfur cluster repair protein YtfE (RIC family)
MNLQERELSVDNYRKLGFRDLEQLYTLRIIPHVTKSLITISSLLKSTWGEKEIPECHHRATFLVEQFIQLYIDHSTKEVTLLSLLLNRHGDTLSVVIPQLKESHTQMRQVLSHVSELALECDRNYSCSSLHKLGYAHINNLRQDISRLFFLEEEYLFPRLSLLH